MDSPTRIMKIVTRLTGRLVSIDTSVLFEIIVFFFKLSNSVFLLLRPHNNPRRKTFAPSDRPKIRLIPLSHLQEILFSVSNMRHKLFFLGYKTLIRIVLTAKGSKECFLRMIREFNIEIW